MKPAIYSYVDSQIAFIVLNDPQRNNSLDRDRLNLFQQALDAALAARDTRAVCFTARGAVFCNGMDFSAARSTADGADHAAPPDGADHTAPPAAAAPGDRAAVPPTAARRAAAQFSHLLTTIQTAPKPVCCVVAGQVRAGGLGIVAAADLVLATEQARFELSELLFGLLPAVVLPFLAERIGMASARYLCLSAENITAADALRIGLIDRITPADRLAQAAAALLRRLLRIDPRMVPLLKQYSTALAAAPSLRQRTDRAADLLARLLQDRDTLAAISGFMEGHTPSWFAPYRPTTSPFEVAE